MLTEKEIEIIEGCRKGDETSQKSLYLTYGPLVKGICLRYTEDVEEAEDFFHDIFIFILTHFENYDRITNLGGWLRVITINKLIDHIRKKKLYNATPMSQLAQEFGNEDSGNYDGIPMKVLLNMINGLPLKYKTAFNLYVIDEIEQDEIETTQGQEVKFNIHVTGGRIPDAFYVKSELGQQLMTKGSVNDFGYTFKNLYNDLTFNVVGGGTKDGFLMQLIADAAGIPVISGPVEATATGNILAQAVAAGNVDGLAAARETVRRSFELVTYTPCAVSSEAFRKAAPAFAKITGA